MSHITTNVLIKGLVGSIIALIIAFIEFTVWSYIGWDWVKPGISYMAPGLGMWFVVLVGSFSINDLRKRKRFLSNVSTTKITVVLNILGLIVFFIITGFALPYLFKSSFAPNPYYGISYNVFMILYAVAWIIYSVAIDKFIIQPIFEK
jgi:hypothetical protein